MRAARPEKEVSVLDLVSFLKNNLKTLLPLALVFSAIGVGLVLLLPREYQKQVTLSVTPVASPSLGRFEQEGSDGLNLEMLRPDEAGQIAVGYLRENNLPKIQMSPKYDKNSQQLDVSLTSQDRNALKGAVPDLVGLTRGAFKGVNEDSLRAALESQSVQVRRDTEVNKRVASQLEEEIQALPADQTARLQALDNSRVMLLTQVEEAEIRLQDLDQAQKDLPRLAAELISVEVVDESGISRARSPLVTIPLAIAAGVGAAVAATFALAALRRK